MRLLLLQFDWALSLLQQAGDTVTDSTDPGAVTHEHTNALECECCQCMLRSVRAGWRSGGKRIGELEAQLAEVTRDRDDHVDACADVAAQRDEISAQLTAMTTRAEAAEAERESLRTRLESSAQHHDEHHERDDKRWALAQEALGLQAAWPALFDRMRQLVGKEAELERFREERRHLLTVAVAAKTLLGHHDNGRPLPLDWLRSKVNECEAALPSTRLYGGKVMAVEGGQQTHVGDPGGDTVNTDPSPTERHSGKLGTGPGHQTTTPADQCRSVAQCDAPCGSAGSGGEVSAGDPPPEPAPAAKCSHCSAVPPEPHHRECPTAIVAIGDAILARYQPGEGSFSVQSAAAPKALPVEEFVTKAELAEILLDALAAWGSKGNAGMRSWLELYYAERGWNIDRLERGGEGRES